MELLQGPQAMMTAVAFTHAVRTVTIAHTTSKQIEQADRMLCQPSLLKLDQLGLPKGLHIVE